MSSRKAAWHLSGTFVHLSGTGVMEIILCY
ncbi:MAG: hypothetical protein RLY31_553 [Bacteroidota bacterium]|jgi:hypothetical protein